MHAGNYLWNCGYFVGSVNTFLQTMKSSAPALLERYEALMGLDDGTKEYVDTYQSFESDSIDYALIERQSLSSRQLRLTGWMSVTSRIYTT